MPDRTLAMPQSVRQGWHWSLLLLLGALFATLIPSWNLGFVGEDYWHLVEESARLPLIASFDGLHRPLRNALFKMGYAVFGLNSAPYHLAIIFLHLAAVVLLYRFVLQLGGNRIAALAAAVLFGFFPRNHQAVFWVAAVADSVVAICALTACSAFLNYLGRPRTSLYLLALFSFALALGFKETAIAILPLLVLVHVTCAIDRSGFCIRRAGLVYLPFVIVEAAYALWVAGFFGRGNLPQQHFYGVQNVAQTIKMAVKFILNMALPFSAPVEARELFRDIPAFAALLIILVAGTICVFCVVIRKRLFFAAGWVVISMAPTAVLGFYSDRYLSLPFLGVAILAGFTAEALIGRARNNPVARVAVFVGLCSYAVVAIARLSHYEGSWKEAAIEVRTTMDQARRMYPHVPNDSVFSFVNLTQSREKGQICIFTAGLSGALWAAGYDTSITTEHTFASTDPREQRLIHQLLSCGTGQRSSASGEYILVATAGLKDVTGACAQSAMEASRQQEPDLWKQE